MGWRDLGSPGGGRGHLSGDPNGGTILKGGPDGMEGFGVTWEGWGHPNGDPNGDTILKGDPNGLERFGVTWGGSGPPQWGPQWDGGVWGHPKKGEMKSLGSPGGGDRATSMGTPLGWRALGSPGGGRGHPKGDPNGMRSFGVPH